MRGEREKDKRVYGIFMPTFAAGEEKEGTFYSRRRRRRGHSQSDSIQETRAALPLPPPDV